jgi:disulfide bond formation protein DsbB
MPVQQPMITISAFSDRSQPLAWLLAAICAGGLATGLFVQHVLGLEPCSLCVLQRLGFVLILLTAVPLAALPRRHLGATVLAVALVAAALFGFGIAAYQVWLQAFPPAMSSCGAGIGAYLEGWPFEQALRWVFDAQGDCSRSSFEILGITLPQWGLIAFAFLSTAALRLFWLVQQR